MGRKKFWSMRLIILRSCLRQNQLLEVRLVAKISPWIPNALNEKLSADFKEEELLDTFKSMAHLKASGYDGFPAFSFKSTEI